MSISCMPRMHWTTRFSAAEAVIRKIYELQRAVTSPLMQLDALESIVKSLNDFWLTKAGLSRQDRSG
jgi:hypothetical protein